MSPQAKFDARKSWGQQLLFKDLETVQTFFKKAEGMSERDLIAALFREDIRGKFFYLEFLAKVYTFHNKKIFKKYLELFKGVEDALGRVDLEKTLLEMAEKVGNKSLENYFKKRLDKAEADLIGTLKKNGFLKNPQARFVKLKTDLESFQWPKGKEDRELFIDYLVSYAKDLRKDIRDYKFDDKDIERGLHELRRKLRWISVQVGVLKGLIQYTDFPLSRKVERWFEKMKAENPDILDNNFVSLPKPIVRNPILISGEVTGMISDKVTMTGKEKTTAELQIYFDEAMEKLDFSSRQRSMVTDKLAQLTGSDEAIDHRELSWRLQKKINKTDLLKDLIDSLE